MLTRKPSTGNNQQGHAAPCAGYGETAGEEAVAQTFAAYLAADDLNPSQLKATDQNVSQFLDFFLEQQEGGALGDTDDDVEPEPDCACI